LVLDFLDGLGANYRAAVAGMLSLLREYVPSHGPTQLRKPITESLGNGIFEFRKEPKGKRVRVLFFYDPDPKRRQVIVCTNGFQKAEKTPWSEIERCGEIRKQYLKDHAAKKNEIVSEDEYYGDEGGEQ